MFSTDSFISGSNADTVLTNALNDEIARATSAETTLTNSLNSEVKRASDAEAELSSTIASNYTTLSTAIGNEKSRAEAQETALNAKIESLGESLGNTNSSTVASGEYSSQDKKIYLTNISGETLSEIDATDFIKDGMVTSVSVVGENLVITFNTDAGHEDILIPISDMFNAENYYTKTEVDAKIDDINSTIEAYGQVTSQSLNDLGTRLNDYGQVTSQALNDLSTKFGDYYNKQEVDAAIANVDVTSQLANYYTKSETSSSTQINDALELKANKTDVEAEIAAREAADNDLKASIDALDAHVSENEDIVSQSLNDLNNRIGENEDIVAQSLNDLNNRIADTYVKSYIDALEVRIAELEARFLNMENNGIETGEY